MSVGRVFVSLAVIAFIGGGVLAGSAILRSRETATALSSSELEMRARQLAAVKLAVMVDETVVFNSAIARYPNGGTSAHAYKIGTKTLAPVMVAIDDAGVEVSEDDLAIADLRAREARYGKLEPRLFDVLAKIPAGDVIPVVFELDAKRPVLPTAPADTSDAARMSWQGEIASRQDRAYRPVVTPFIAILASKGIAGHVIESAARIASPWVYASCTADQIRMLASRGEVLLVSFSPPATPD